MTNDEFQSRMSVLEAALQAKLGVKGKSLTQRLRKAGRRLPKKLHRYGDTLEQASTRLAHPKLARQVDFSAVSKAFEAFKLHLDKIDPADRRKGIILAWLGGLIINLIVIVLVVYGLIQLIG